MSGGACPCGSGRKYSNCCRRLHHGAQCEEPEQLMRARYSAYVLGEIDFLVRTHRVEGGKPDRAGIEQTSSSTSWRGLSVLSRGMEGPDDGWVEFVARFLQPDGSRGFLHERSRFERVDGAWAYVSGQPGRPRPSHALCLCGSGKKSKKCCGRAA